MRTFGLSASKRTHNFIIESFLDLIPYKSFRKITIQDILLASTISKGTFYKHFTDKYDLLHQSYQFLFDEMKESMLVLDVTNHIKDYLNTINRIRIRYQSLMQIKEEDIDIHDKFLKDLSLLYKEEHPESSQIEQNLYASQMSCAIDYLVSLNREIREEDLLSVFNIQRKMSFQFLNAY